MLIEPWKWSYIVFMAFCNLLRINDLCSTLNAFKSRAIVTIPRQIVHTFLLLPVFKSVCSGLEEEIFAVTFWHDRPGRCGELIREKYRNNPPKSGPKAPPLALCENGVQARCFHFEKKSNLPLPCHHYLVSHSLSPSPSLCLSLAVMYVYLFISSPPFSAV